MGRGDASIPRAAAAAAVILAHTPSLGSSRPIRHQGLCKDVVTVACLLPEIYLKPNTLPVIKLARTLVGSSCWSSWCPWSKCFFCEHQLGIKCCMVLSSAVFYYGKNGTKFQYKVPHFSPCPQAIRFSQRCLSCSWGRGVRSNARLSFLPSSMHLFLLLCYNQVLWSLTSLFSHCESVFLHE